MCVRLRTREQQSALNAKTPQLKSCTGCVRGSVYVLSDGSPDQLVGAEDWLSQQETQLSPPTETINTTDNSQTVCAAEPRV